MFEVRIQAVFCAAHSLRIGGVPEPVHGHTWNVEAAVAGETLDADGLLVDFHALEHRLHEIVRPWNNANLNEVIPFDRLNPSAENVAKRIADELGSGLEAIAGSHARSRAVRIAWVSVTEAPGCLAKYTPGSRN